MAIFQDIGKALSFVGGAQDFLPNKILEAFHLPKFTGPMQFWGDFLQNPKKLQFGRAWGNNAKLGALAAGAYFGLPALAHLVGIGGGAASGAHAVADVGANAALPSGTTAAFGGMGGGPTAELMDMFGAGSAPAVPSQGLIGGTGGATGAVHTAAGTSPGAGAKGMNPIMKSFLDEFIKSRFQQQQWQPPELSPMGRTGNPGRQYLPTLGGAWGAG